MWRLRLLLSQRVAGGLTARNRKDLHLVRPDAPLGLSRACRQVVATRLPRPPNGSPAQAVGGCSFLGCHWKPGVALFVATLRLGVRWRRCHRRSASLVVAGWRDATLGTIGTAVFGNIWKSQQNRGRHWSSRLPNLA